MLILAALGVVFLALPPLALLFSAPWPRLWSALTAPQALDALRLSLLTASIATALAAVIGIPLAWVLGTIPFRGASVVRVIVLLPMVLPPVIGGAALLLTFGRRSVIGSAFATIGVSIPFTPIAVVLAQLFVSMPFLVASLEGAFRANGREREEAAATLGVSPTAVLLRVTLPAVAPAVVGAIAVTWARAIGEFGATITFAGSVRGITQTLPVAVNELLGHDLNSALAICVLMIIISALVLVVMRGRWLGVSR